MYKVILGDPLSRALIYRRLGARLKRSGQTMIELNITVVYTHFERGCFIDEHLGLYQGLSCEGIALSVQPLSSGHLAAVCGVSLALASTGAEVDVRVSLITNMRRMTVYQAGSDGFNTTSANRLHGNAMLKVTCQFLCSIEKEVKE